MCLVLLDLRRDALRLASVRDEFLDRPADAPGRHWAHLPHVVGGRDRSAAGTWLAVDCRSGRVAVVFTALDTPTTPGLHTRGELPLTAVSAGTLDGVEPSHYAPFALVLAGRDLPGGPAGLSGTWWAWDGRRLSAVPVGPGRHTANIAGLDAVAASRRQAHWHARLAGLPEATPASVHRAGRPAEDDALWRAALADDPLPADDPRAFLVRGQLRGRPFGSSVASLVSVPAAGPLRYEVTTDPLDPTAWRDVPCPGAAAA